MNKNKSSQAAVLIPLHTSDVKYRETISLTQCIRILSSYDIYFITPYGLKKHPYYNTFPKVKIVGFPDYFFHSVTSYSKLLLSSCFYRKFLFYKYILIHQLDAFVFSNQLENWCKKNYSYIGAPWSNDQQRDLARCLPLLPKNRFILHAAVGNGGFSLRKVREFYYLSFILNKIFLKWPLTNEDIYWCLIAPLIDPFFKIPSKKEAALFSLETNPKEFFSNSHSIPFGCHAWEKYDLEFWKPFISSFGHSL